MPTGIVGEFLDLKAETDADILAMQCGDFYEFFADDAELVADELDLTVSQKSSHGSSYPMAGVPLSELTPYVKALVERGYRVAVADQYETEDGHAPGRLPASSRLGRSSKPPTTTRGTSRRSSARATTRTAPTGSRSPT